MRVVINAGRDFDCDTALAFLLAGTPALWAGFSNNNTLAMALSAGGSMNEATEDALLDSLYLPGAITARASAGLTTGLGANTLAQGAVLSARNI